MERSYWLAQVMRSLGWRLWVFGGLGLALLLAIPGVWVYQEAADRFSRGGEPVNLGEESGEVVVVGETYSIPDLTKEAGFVRDAFRHDATLIASIPTPTPTFVVGATPEGLSGTPFFMGSGEEGVPLGGGGLDWFDPERGLFFYREGNGDWTEPGVREDSPFRSLVEYDRYPEGVSNFADGSLVYDLAVQLTFGMVETKPEFGTPTAAMIAVMARNVAWEMVGGVDVPAFRVWSDFVYETAEGVRYEYAVGGVVVMAVGELADGSHYLVLGQFVEPGVVVQRLSVGGG